MYVPINIIFYVIQNFKNKKFKHDDLFLIKISNYIINCDFELLLVQCISLNPTIGHL